MAVVRVPGIKPDVRSREIKTIIEASGLTAEMHANGTNIEGDLADICRLAERCEARLAEMGVPRTFFMLIFSTRRDKDQSMADKMTAVSGGPLFAVDAVFASGAKQSRAARRSPSPWVDFGSR